MPGKWRSTAELKSLRCARSFGNGRRAWQGSKFVVDEILRNQCIEKLEWNLGVGIEKLKTDVWQTYVGNHE